MKAISKKPIISSVILILINLLLAIFLIAILMNGIQTDLVNYRANSVLYTKLNKLNNPENYISNWEPAYNSYTDEYDASVSPVLGSSGFQLKYYTEKNGEYNALGLVKDGVAAHNLEAALESLDGFLRDRFNLADDFIYDMHLYNSLNFMNYYCND